MSDLISDDAFVRLFQRKAGLEPDGWAGPDTIAALDKLFPTPQPAGQEGLPDSYWPMLSKIESNDRPYVKAKTSSASGLYQFTKATWESMGGEWGGEQALAFGGLKPSPAEQYIRVRELTERNAAYLQGEGVPINRASLYAAHFLGAPTARRVLAADISERADLLAGPAATRANRSILEGKTVGEFFSWLYSKTGDWVR